tara:strand:+ start:78 stop:779 length:702 start_codon:yes stop_codon:yes gene_type:complete
MSYFRELPNILYPSNLVDKESSQQYIAVKNLFRRVKLSGEADGIASLFTKYTILEGQRPDTIAKAFYKNETYDWVVVLTSGITNIKDQWPLSNYDLNRYVENKYGLTEMNNIHHYETLEVIDSKNRLILSEGMKVDQSFKIPAPLDTNITYTIVGAYESTKHTGSGDLNPVKGISNYEYETKLNESKRKINLLKPKYLMRYIDEMKQIMTYDRNSQYINGGLIVASNNRLVGP